MKAEQLANPWEGDLSPFYLVSGDEPLLVQEACDSIRAAARATGFDDREVFEAAQHFDWVQVLNEANSLSLFASRKILEVRLPSGKPGKDGGRFLQEYCENISPDNLLLLVLPRLDRSATNSAWFKTLDNHGTVIQIWPVNARQMPQWISQRLRAAGIEANAQAIEVLAERVEGNLLAASQEIEKLKLLIGEQKNIDAETMSSVVSDSARYSIFTLVDRALAGESEAAARTLYGLRNEGTEPLAVLWALTRELRTLIKAEEQMAAGEHGSAALQRLGVWQQRQGLVRNALKRLKPAQLNLLLRQTAGIDRAIKGMRDACPWQELNTVVLSLSGKNPIHPNNLRLALRESGAP
ncbi:MAG TPA: DNA polymerase III subunit delta [Porticoccaceae bacterium]|nr:DNA polymerase III subunit delta [Porticoccaceae bacterium]